MQQKDFVVDEFRGFFNRNMLFDKEILWSGDSPVSRRQEFWEYWKMELSHALRISGKKLASLQLWHSSAVAGSIRGNELIAFVTPAEIVMVWGFFWTVQINVLFFFRPKQFWRILDFQNLFWMKHWLDITTQE